MPSPTTFIQIMTRDQKDPSKDGIKVKKIEFMFNYFEKERLWHHTYSLDEVKKEEQSIMIERIGINHEDYMQLDE